jgi:hypothetical protein
LLAHPLHQLIDGDDIVAVVTKERGIDGQFPLPTFGEEKNGVASDGSVNRRALLFEIGNKFKECPGIENCSGKAVRPNLACLLNDVNILRLEGLA